MSNTKKKGIASGIAAIFAAATMLMFGISGDTVFEVNYELEKGESICEMAVFPPEDAEVDIVELYCNDNLVTKTVLPNGTLKSIPFVFSNLNNLELRLYKLNEVIGIGKFKDEKLYVAFNDDTIKSSETSEEAKDANE